PARSLSSRGQRLWCQQFGSGCALPSGASQRRVAFGWISLGHRSPGSASCPRGREAVSGEIIGVEPLSTWLENWKAPTSAVTRAGNTIYVSGFPPFEPETG